MPYLTLFGLTFLSGFLPFVNAEACLLSTAVLTPTAQPLAVALAATCGQMCAKGLLFLAGRGVLQLPLGRHAAHVESAAARLRGRRSHAIVFASALTGLPPFYVISIAAGLLQMRLSSFLCIGTGGRLLRFSALAFAPRLLSGLWS